MTTTIDKLLGKTLTEVRGAVGEDEVFFRADDGKAYKLYHEQDCCETVRIEDICGDLNDLVGSPITQAEESTNQKTDPDDFKSKHGDDSFTWTFYRLATAKGQVVIRGTLS
ncbi:MAG TPA: hypothetical protein VIV60_30480 [Polyangiaceae bacterium]